MTLPHAHVSDVTLARVMPGRMEQFVSGHYAEGLGGNLFEGGLAG